MPVAVVDADNCNGCRRCFADCPYAAITMVPHPSGRPGRQLASVDAALCAGCGICAGSCPSSTPFRSLAELATGIDMPGHSVGNLRRDLLSGLGGMHAAGRIVVFGCEQGADLSDLAAGDVLTLPLLCAGQLPPSFVEYALHDGAAAVVVVSCPQGGCAFRLGARWTAERLQGIREPYLRARVPRHAVSLVEADSGETAQVQAALVAVRERLRAVQADARSLPGPRHA